VGSTTVTTQPTETTRPGVTATSTTLPMALNLGESDRGRAFRVPVGATVTVRLDGPAHPGALPYDEPLEVGTVLERRSGSADAATGGATAVFDAIAPGDGQIGAGAACDSSQGCTAAFAWYANITVVP
jgi:hypothetical protein